MGRISVRGGATHAVGSTTVSDANLEVVCGDGVHRPYQDLGIAASADVTAAVAAEAAARDAAIAAQATTDAGTYVRVVGSPATPITDANTARPSGIIVYWVCAKGVTPANASNGDLIWNAAA